jgi:DNA-binding transcriptional MerR regulator
VDKAPDAYRTISEVAEDLDLPQHVLRFWETRFSQIKPLKRGGGRRYYRPEDIDLLKGIRHLLYGEGYTIRGVQRIIKENGVKAMQALGRGEGSAALPKPGGPEVVSPKGPVSDETARPSSASGLRASLKGLIPTLRPDGEPHAAAEPEDRPEPYFDTADGHAEADDFDSAEEEFFAAAPSGAEPVDTLPLPPAASRASAASVPQLAADDIRRLEAALDELTECRKRLDQAYDAR